MRAPSTVVAIDGPAGAGKSTIARRVAQGLGFTWVDTGAIYRSVAWLALQKKVPFDDAQGLGALVSSMDIRFELESERNRSWVGDVEVSDAIREPEIDRAASIVSAVPTVRHGLLELQRKLASRSSSVLEGRDIGTVVCPSAAVKIFLDASVEIRARRRHDQAQALGRESDFDIVLRDVRDRDHRDRNREYAPLRAADDAYYLDSTHLNADEVVDIIIKRVHALAE